VDGGAGATCATIEQHSPDAAEIYLMAVAQDVELLQIKTLSASRPDAGTARRRAFWLACGFRPLEELPTLWDPSNPALQLIKTVAPAARTA
jgi:hypothetical protein